MKNIHKRFAGVHALKGVDFDLTKGEVHAIIGENGAGKSTLIKILGGIYSKDEGEIYISGKPVNNNTVNEAKENHISIIHQELVLVPGLSVAENIFLGVEPRNKIGLLDYEKMHIETDRMLEALHVNIKATDIVSSLTIAQQQMVEIVKAVSFNANIIVMDEPTSSLSDKEVDSLFDCIRLLTDNGCGIIYISHRMSELNQIADRVTVLRDGNYIATRNMKEVTNDDLVSLMVGREMVNYYTRTFNKSDEVVLEVNEVNTDIVNDISFTLRKGEILGFAGLVGAGRSETMRSIFGIDKISSGDIYLNGKKLQISSPVDAMKSGICLVPENRKEEAIFPDQNVKSNLTLKVLKKFIKGIRVDDCTELGLANVYMERLNIRASGIMQKISSLSGGNQQKVVLGSWLATNPKVLILDEPTRGIDVGAKAEIYEIMNELTLQGMAIIMVSSELPEVINMSDRVIVMRQGRISTTLDRADISQESIMHNAVNI